MAEDTEEVTSDETQDENEETPNTTEDEDEEEVVEDEVEDEEEVDEEEVPVKKNRRDERIQELVEEKNTLLRLLEQKTNESNRATDEQDDDLDPEVAKILDKRLNKLQLNHRQQLGAVVEKLDETETVLALGNDVYTSDVKSTIQKFREDKASEGKYYTRVEAFDLLKSKGLLKLPKKTVKKEVRKITVVKKKPTVGTEKSTTKSQRPSGTSKNFKELTFEQKEKALGDKTF